MTVMAHADTGYNVVQSVATAQGKLQILEDARLSRALERKLWDSCVDIVDVLGDDNPQAKPFIGHPLLPAKLVQTDAWGRSVIDMVFEKQAPIARIESRRLGVASDPVFTIETDDDACMGSYSGRAVWFFKLGRDRIGPVMAKDSHGKTSQVFLFSSLKSAWWFVKRKPSDIEIEQVYCRPDNEHYKPGADLQFFIHYITFRFDGSDWRRAERVEPGTWEGDEGFPSRNKFP